MTVIVAKPEFDIRAELAGVRKQTGRFGESILRTETVADFLNVVGTSRNMIINGDMKIFQRDNAGLITTGSSANQIHVDRFGGQFHTANVFTVSRETDAPPGFSHSVKYVVTNAVTPNANHYFQVGQNIEGLNSIGLGWHGTNKKPLTISFWVKSNAPGRWALAIKSSTSTTGYLTTYDINASNVWEYKSVTIPPPNTGTWATDNTGNIRIQFDLGTSRSGDLYASSRNRWLSENIYADANTKKIHGVSGAFLQITGLQAEIGSAPTPFEYRNYTTELMMCQRYCERYQPAYATWHTGYGYNDAIYMQFPWKVEKRAGGGTTTFSGTGSSLLIAYGNSSSSGHIGSNFSGSATVATASTLGLSFYHSLSTSTYTPYGTAVLWSLATSAYIIQSIEL